MMDASLVASLLQSTVKMSVPLLLAATGEVVAERAGVINIGIEGKLLSGAFAAMAVTFALGSPVAGIAAAVAVGVALAAVSAYLIVVRSANQVVVGTAINILAVGMTGVAYRAMFGITGTALTIRGPATGTRLAVRNSRSSLPGWRWKCCPTG